MAPSRSSSLVRALLGGVSLGALGAAGVLAWASWNNAHRPCEFPGTQECSFQQATDGSVARLQGYAAIGFALLGGGLSLSLRRS